MKITTKFLRCTSSSTSLDRVDGTLPLLPNSSWRSWLRIGSRRTGLECHIRPREEEEGITFDEAPWWRSPQP
jgi:hypothetical protein